MEVETSLNVNLDAARALQESLQGATLRILGDRDKFKSHRLEGVEWEGGSVDDSLKDPAFVANDVADQIVSECNPSSHCRFSTVFLVVFSPET